MERSTFRSIIVVSSMQKRQRYEECLASMPLFASLSLDQCAAIADCLSLDTFQVCSLPNDPLCCGLHLCPCVFTSMLAVAMHVQCLISTWRLVQAAQDIAYRAAEAQVCSPFCYGTC